MPEIADWRWGGTRPRRDVVQIRLRTMCEAKPQEGRYRNPSFGQNLSQQGKNVEQIGCQPSMRRGRGHTSPPRAFREKQRISHAG